MAFILFLIIFFCLQSFVLFCCVAAGNDPASQLISDQEQMDYIKTWMENHEIVTGIEKNKTAGRQSANLLLRFLT